MGNKDHYYWADLYIHRFISDYKKLMKFDTYAEAEFFREHHPSIENDFDVWIVETSPDSWDKFYWDKD